MSTNLKYLATCRHVCWHSRNANILYAYAYSDMQQNIDIFIGSGKANPIHSVRRKTNILVQQFLSLSPVFLQKELPSSKALAAMMNIEYAVQKYVILTSTM